jgi:peptidoglycan/LPS O-acetylase OafA/YrhL
LEFYARRIRRLFPALITVLLLCLAYGWIILLPGEFQQLGKHTAAGTLFIQNFVFWKESGYFDIHSNLKPLLNLWSLGVEEQFYIFFPLLMVLLWKRKWVKWQLGLIMGVLLCISFIANVKMSNQNVVSDFYLTPYRAWEFLAGSLLAWWHYDKGHEGECPKHSTWISCAGLILLMLSMTWIHPGDSHPGWHALVSHAKPFPGWRALLPVCGTLLLIEAGKGSWVNRKILSHPAIVWVGLISYPLYLFHWPALSFVRIVNNGGSPNNEICAALGISVLLAVLTYYFVEQKLRRYQAKWVVPSLVSGFVLTGIFGLLAMSKIIAPNIDPRIEKTVVALKDTDFFRGANQHASEVGLFTIGGHGPQTLFLGDSNMEQYMPRAVKIFGDNRDESRGALFIVYTGLPPIPGFNVHQFANGLSLIPEMEAQLKAHPSIDRVVIAGAWTRYFINGENTIGDIPATDPRAIDKAMEALGSLIHKLHDQGKKVTLLLSIPMGPKFSPANSLDRHYTSIHYKDPETFTKEEFLNGNRSLLEKIAVTSGSNGAEVVDPLDSLCQEGFIMVNDEDGFPLSYDGYHLRPGFVSEHLKYLDDTLAP